ncbi:MAG: magnesium transporter CorA family protein [Candidatus Eremiobacteraeota bacterium]|nr:magnesium transporter CorA family protein [Candidatus Eremiobacteraeota bacterium]
MSVPTPAGMAPPTRCLTFRDDGSITPLSDLSAISEVLTHPGTFVWLDTVDPKNGDLQLLQEEFSLHPLAIEDAIKAHQRSKIDAYEGFWFIIVHATAHGERTVPHSEIAIFAGERFVVTVRHSPPYPLDEIERRWKTITSLKRDSGALVYTILDTIVDDYFPIVDAFEVRVEALERNLLAPPSGKHATRDLLRGIMEIKGQLQTMRHVVAPVDEILARIVRSDVRIFGPDEIVYYHDVQDHVLRLLSRIDSLREMVTASLSIHWSLAASRQADVSRQLTIIATIFLPLSFITGFFGQNFGYLINHITTTRDFWILGIGTELLALALLVAYFARKRWL